MYCLFYSIVDIYKIINRIIKSYKYVWKKARSYMEILKRTSTNNGTCNTF